MSANAIQAALFVMVVALLVKPIGALAILRRNLLIYGLGGVIVPFIGINFIDVIIAALHLI